MQITTIINRKGGVGKTAAAQAIAAGLNQRGYKTLLIDLDSQTNLTHATGADVNAPGAFELLTAHEDLITPEIIQHTKSGDIISGNSKLAAMDKILTDTGKEYVLKERLIALVNMCIHLCVYDYVYIDTPAALGTITTAALTASNNILIPAQADIYSLQGINLLHESIETVKKYCNHDLKVLGVFLTRYNPRARLSKDIAAALEETAHNLNSAIFKTYIRECIAIKEAQAMQQDVFTYAPKSNAAADYNALIKEILERGKA